MWVRRFLPKWCLMFLRDIFRKLKTLGIWKLIIKRTCSISHNIRKRRNLIKGFSKDSSFALEWAPSFAVINIIIKNREACKRWSNLTSNNLILIFAITDFNFLFYLRNYIINIAKWNKMIPRNCKCILIWWVRPVSRKHRTMDVFPSVDILRNLVFATFPSFRTQWIPRLQIKGPSGSSQTTSLSLQYISFCEKVSWFLLRKAYALLLYLYEIYEKCQKQLESSFIDSLMVKW